MDHEFIILGGGLAGLAAASRLAELGARPLLIEAGKYPCHKVCGEFLSPGSLALLNKWNVHPVLIQRAHLHTPSKSLTLSFPSPAGSLSHLQLDPALADYAAKNGAILLTSTKVIDLRPALKQDDYHQLTLESGETLQARHLLVAAGRLPQFSSSDKPKSYVGIKAHFKGLDLKNSLEMFSFPGAYIGLSPIEEGKCNIACLARSSTFLQKEPAEAFIRSLGLQHPLLNAYLSQGQNLFSQWMQVSIPEFGIKNTPPWPRAYFIGDAAGTIPPACGNGLTMALLGGYLAADFAFKGEDKNFRRAWKRQYRSQIIIGKGLQQLMMNPELGNIFLRLNIFFPSLAPLLFSITR